MRRVRNCLVAARYRRFAAYALLRSASELCRPRWHWSAALGAALVCLAPRTVHAEPIRKVSIYVQGTDAQTVRKEIASLVPSGVEVDTTAFGRAFEKTGFARNPKFDSSSKLGAQVGKSLGVSKADLALVVRVRKQKAGRVAHVLAFRRGESAPQLDETIELGKKSGSDAEQAALSDKLSGLFPAAASADSSAAAPPDKAEPEPETESEPPPAAAAAPSATERAEAEPAATSAVGQPSFVVALALGAAARSFAYKQRVSGNLRPFSLWGIAIAQLDLEGYPLSKSPGALKNLGLFGSVMFGLPSRVETADDTGEKPKANYDRFSAGLRYRIAFGESALSISGAFVGQDYTFKKSGSLAETVPTVRYRSIEPALDASLAAGPVRVLLGVGYRFVLGGGKLLDRFPNASVGAVDAHLGAALPLGGGHWALRGILGYERYFYTMHSKIDDEYVAGGALDRYYELLFGMSYAF